MLKLDTENEEGKEKSPNVPSLGGMLASSADLFKDLQEVYLQPTKL